ncbi:MAG: sugar ABC transporter ATP-binding protein, partial [Gammaproteobacteria bacterium]
GIRAEVAVVEPTGAETLVVARMAGKEIQSAFHERHGFRPGHIIHLRPRAEMVHLFDAASEKRLN